MKKRIVLFLLVLAFMVPTAFTGYAGNYDPDKEAKKQEKALSSYKKFLEKRNINQSIDDSFGGAFIDDQEILNIYLVGNDYKMQKDINDSNIIYHNAKWSKKQLEKALKKLNSNMAEYNISATELDEKNNTIIVYMKELSKDQMKKITDDLGISNITFKKMDVEIVFTTEVINGDPVQVPVGTGTATDTIGVGVKHNSTGKLGFLMPGHTAAAVGCTAKYAGSNVGTLKQKVLSGTVDGAFVECNSSYTPTKKFMNGDTYEYCCVDPTNLVVGGYVEKYGRVMGLHSASALANGQWVPDSSFSLFSPIDDIFNSLNVNDF